MTDEGRQAGGQKDEDAHRHSPQPKPISRVRWADLADEEEKQLLTRRIEEDLRYRTHKQLMELSEERSRSKPWPKHWKDILHDEDGGHDLFGRRTPQDGRELLKSTLAKLGLHNGMEYASDDVTGVELDPKLMKEAREVEMTFFKKMVVYTRVPRSMQRMRGGKIIGVRWVDVNKGDQEKPDYRSRLVGQEFNTAKDDELYASTPPLEALRYVVSSAATWTEDNSQRHIMVNDVRRAYFYAKTNRELYIELPKEDTEAGWDEVGKLNLSLYGTRDAAKNWQEHLSRHLEEIGFVRGVGHPSVYYHPSRGLVTLVHGDDYTIAGSIKDLQVQVGGSLRDQDPDHWARRRQRREDPQPYYHLDWRWM